ncbi:MAG: hypothetical protein MRZ79_20150 [Bacteroidia bacterium]|nr:hypothetical protein [Bacteroidia bacterium]
MKRFKHTAFFSILVFSMAACATFENPSEGDERVTSFLWEDFETGESIFLENWSQFECDTVTPCAFTTARKGLDSVVITATANFTLFDSVLNVNYSFVLNFNHRVLIEQSNLVDSVGKLVFESPDRWWNEFFVGSQWLSFDRFASLSFGRNVSLGTSQFSPNSPSSGFIWVNRVNRFLDENGKQCASMDGEFGALLLEEDVSLEPRYRINDGRFFVKFPLE